MVAISTAMVHWRPNEQPHRRGRRADATFRRLWSAKSTALPSHESDVVPIF